MNVQNMPESFMALISEISLKKKKQNKTKQEMLISFNVFNVSISKTSVGYRGELSVANHYLTSRDGMFVCFQGILLNTLSEFLRKMEKYKAFPRPHSTCDCII